MRNGTYYALVMVSLGGLAQAQSTFDRIYLSSANAKMNLIELQSNHVLAGLAWGPGVSLLDAEGNIISTQHYWSDSILVQRSIRRASANAFFLVLGYRQDSCSASGNLTVPHTYPAIGRTDSMGNVLDIRHYRLNTDGCWSTPDDLEVTADNGVITWGGSGPGAQRSFYGMRVDSLGVPLWGKNFDRHGSFKFIKELPGGDLLAGFEMDTAGACVARMDANGNFLWCNSYVRPGGELHDAVVDSDSAFVITGLTEAADQSQLFMLRLNGAGEVQWCRGYGSGPNGYEQEPSRIERTLDGNYVVLATLKQSAGISDPRPFLMKTDVSGDTLWTRSVGGGNSYYTKDLLVCSDGGYMISGTIYGDLPQGWTGAPFIVKADSLGHFSCLERSAPVQLVDLFPSDSAVVLTALDGATVYPAFVNDTIFDPIASYDACLFTSAPVHLQGRKASIRPNPNTGRFTVEFPDPLMAESYYSVYDAMGRLLLQRPLPTGSTTEQVDISRFGMGTYVIKFTSPEGVQHERVVVE